MLQELLNILIELRDDPTFLKVVPDEILEDGGYYASDLDPRVQKVLNLADSVLINKDGHPNFQNIRVLKQHGFHVCAGEQDSFGWLTGLITVGYKGQICFG